MIEIQTKCIIQYGGRLGEFNGMSSQSHVPHCRVLPLGEFTVMIPEPHGTLQGAVTSRNQCHDRGTLQGVRIPSTILKIVFRHMPDVLGLGLYVLIYGRAWYIYADAGTGVYNHVQVWLNCFRVGLCLLCSCAICLSPLVLHKAVCELMKVVFLWSIKPPLATARPP